MTSEPKASRAESDLLAAVRQAARQEQFLEVVSAEEAKKRFAAHLDLAPLPGERVSLEAALGRVLADDLAAPIDVPPFDRASVDGFALRATDTAGAADGAPKQIALNAEVIACGHAPMIEVKRGTATTIATGGVVPRGADAVVMIEHTELIESIPAIELRRAATPGQFISYAGSDIARGETLMRKGQTIGSREIGMLAACGLAGIDVVRRPRSPCSRPATSWCRSAKACAPAASTISTAPSSRPPSPRPAASRCSSARFPTTRRRWSSGAPRARPMRHRRAVGRHVEGRRRSFASGGVATRQARHPGAWRGAETRQAALSRRRRRQADRSAAGISDLGDLHLPCFRRAGDPRPSGPAAGGSADHRRPACRCASPRRWAARSTCWCRSLRASTGRSAFPSAERLRRGDELFAGRRLHRDRRAGRRARCRHAGARHSDRRISAGARHRHHGQPRHRA